MEYIYAVMLLHGAGKEISESSVINILNEAGINPDNMRVKALIAALEGIDIDEALKAPVYSAALAPAASPAEEKKAEKPEKEVKEEEEDLQGLSILFGPPS